MKGLSIMSKVTGFAKHDGWPDKCDYIEPYTTDMDQTLVKFSGK